MATLDFPASPTNGQKYPASPIAGVPTYTWDGEKWTTTGNSIIGQYVAKGGDTMTGALLLPTPPVADRTTKAATTAFVNQDQVILSGVDLNTITAPGTYVCQGSGNNPNEPTAGGQWYLHVITYGGATVYTVQQAYSLATADVVIYTRVQVNGAWYPWKQTINSAGGPFSIASAADFVLNASNKLLTCNAVWNAAASVVAGSTSALTPDLAASIDFTWQINSASGALNNPVNAKAGQKGIITITPQSAGCAITTWGNAYRFPGGTKPTITATSGAIDTISYYAYSPTIIFCTFSGGFA